MGQHSIHIGLGLLQTFRNTSQRTQTRVLELGGGLRLPRGQKPCSSASALELTGAPTAPIDFPQIIATVRHSPLLVRANGENGT